MIDWIGPAQHAAPMPPTAARRPATSRSEKATVILTAAARLFSRHGFAATSMRDVAREAGASLGSIYHHFPSKEEILRELIAGNFRRVASGLEQRLEGVEDPREAVRLFVANHVAFFAEHLDEMRVMSHEMDVLGGAAGREIRELRRAYTRRGREILGRLRPDLSDERLDVATLCLFGTMNWTYRWWELARRSDPETLGREMADLFLDGFVAHGKVRRR